MAWRSRRPSIFHHEPEAAVNLGNGTAGDFIAAWRKVVTVLRQQGVTNAEYVWTMTDYSFWVQDRRRASLWYPGDAYVDHLGADAYNWYRCRPGVNTPWWSLQQIIEPFRQFGQAHPTKGLMLPEWASAEDPAPAEPPTRAVPRPARTPSRARRPGRAPRPPGRGRAGCPPRRPAAGRRAVAVAAQLDGLRRRSSTSSRSAPSVSGRPVITDASASDARQNSSSR